MLVALDPTELARLIARPRMVLPLLGGEGWGEGELLENKLNGSSEDLPHPGPLPKGEGARNVGAGSFTRIAALVAFSSAAAA